MLKNLIGALAFALPLTLPAQTVTPRPPVPPPLKVGFVYVSPVGQAGWSYQHEQGRLALQQALGAQVQTTRVEGVAEGPDAERVMRELARDGHRLIFATSFGYLEPALRVAADHPEVVIEHAGGHKTAANLNTYNARYYEARWLAGWLAGRTSASGTAGYVAGFPVPEVIQGINAFTLGMRAANPQATVKVIWLNTWFDPSREREAAMTLVRQGADVLTNHSGSPAVPQAAEALGVKVIAYQSDMRAFAPTAQVAAVTHHWGAHYTGVAKRVLDGRWTPTPVWGGLKDGLVRVEALSPSLPRDVVDGLRQRERDLLDGRLKPFSGRLHDQQGRERLAGGALDDAQIARMDWLVQGVVAPSPGRPGR
ncbi:BMP family ABC transporter substrate-binding protein [Aquabacterium sp. J223]|uniref:BMP family ABC transporter substrate-binding protein n=1 Tax=Aquabacterium sp. J223 TaxID=2898431 RepID=UPI0021ADBA00|nr:BMP family ABC transporter substrate-binding protein [Aquabacterium sp. J223]UUX94906.1 BMP family ABC transporter substrate-binding protein [Aquabacterium sp. J223]